jgi:aspartokinase/homoserine dehydrogenase 1
MNVLKFGGTSMGSAESMKQVGSILKKYPAPVAVVVSAMSGTTDLLIQCGELASKGDENYKEILQKIEDRHLETTKSLVPVQHQSSLLSLIKKGCNEIHDICNGIFLIGECSLKTKDKLMSYGEWLSSKIFTAALQHSGLNAEWVDSRSLIRTNSQYGNAQVDFKTTNTLIQQYFHSAKPVISVLPGFIASDSTGVTTTLGRGGSDYTAAIIAAGVKAEVLEIWTDVSGMMTADPRWVPNAKIIPSISYQEAMELSHFGAKVIYPPTIQPALDLLIPILIKNTFAPEDPGTRISQHSENKHIIRGISSINSIALISLEGSGMIGIPGFSARLFEALASAKINVIIITQGSSEHSICVGINESETEKASEAVNRAFELEISAGKIQPLQVEGGLSVVAVVGDNMKMHTGVSGRMFSTLGRHGVNIRAIAQGSTERNITAVVFSKDVKKAINVLHEEFFESVKKHMHLFIAGAGNVGKRLLSQIRQQQPFLEKELNLQLHVNGISNSRKMIISDESLSLNNWEEDLGNSEKADLNTFINQMIEKNLPNSVFADVTAHAEVAEVYHRLLEKSIAVVACNKIAASSSYSRYRELKDLAREFNAPFLFETNVGAGLPVIGTLNDLRKSGDRINRMEAVLSGTLNFVFNHYDGSRSFASVVKQAQDEGYTEPDPRLDLSGKDVMRKIMILAREAGESIEMEDIVCNGFLPDSCLSGTVEDFYKSLEKEEPHFKKLFQEASGKKAKLKFIASFERQEWKAKASVGLQHIPAESDFYHLYGKDNLVLFFTDRYKDQPMVIKGAGAGADVTASGVFADILRTV